MKLRIEGLANGGDGLARHPESGRAIFVSGALPGDEIEGELAGGGKVLRARLETIVNPSPHRQSSRCDSRPRCGGCPWQELELEEASRWKARLLMDSMERFAAADRSWMEANLEQQRVQNRGRHRVHLRLDGKGRPSYHEAGSHDLVTPTTCPALAPALEQTVLGLAGLGHQLRGSVVEVAAALDDHRGVRALRLFPAPRRRGQATSVTAPGLKHLAQTIVSRGLADGVWAELEDGSTVRSGEIDLGGLVGGDPSFKVRAGGFFQADPAVNASMIERLAEMVQPERKMRVLDMHAGAGNFGLAMALRRCDVQASEIDGDAFEDLQKNQAILGGKGRFEALRMTGAQALSRGSQRRPPAVVIFDGPRRGDREGAAAIARFQPPRVAAFGCNPVTFARDLAEMGLGTRYGLRRLGFWEAFPWTHHQEAFALLELQGA